MNKVKQINTPKQITIGDLVKDKISGLKGICNEITYWMNGCVRIGVQSNQLTEKNTIPKQIFFDRNQVEFLEKTSLTFTKPIKLTRELAYKLIGKKAIDKISGFKGIIESITIDISNKISVRVCLQQLLDRNEIHCGYWFPLERVSISKKRIIDFIEYEDDIETHCGYWFPLKKD